MSDSKPDFSVFNDKRVAVVLAVGGQSLVCTGIATYQSSALVGGILGFRIEGEEDAGQPELILSEDGWSGEIQPGARYGCEYCFIPASRGAAG
jgi:hypothetical protein